jgi:Rps23 Pro-64 3,4-dihydroxylase Tpa1-like proline 4-hydroxylase
MVSPMAENAFFKPPVHGRLANWLGPQMVERLLAFAHARRDTFHEAAVWNNVKGEGEVDLTTRRSWKTTHLGSLEDEIQARVRLLLPKIWAQLGTDPIEACKFEIEMVAHCDGAFFREHQDWNRGRLSGRLISIVYYFYRLPKSFSGGALRIYPIAGSKKSATFVEIEPINDSLVFFPSWFPHEVLPVSCPARRFEDSRFSINCWVCR